MHLPARLRLQRSGRRVPLVRSVLLSSRSEHPRLCLAQHRDTHSVLPAHCCAPAAGQPGCCGAWLGTSWAVCIAVELSMQNSLGTCCFSNLHSAAARNACKGRTH